MCHGSSCMHICVHKCVPISLILRHPARVPLIGAHVNPSVTVALVVIGKFPLRKVPHYLLGQYAGGFLAAALVYCVYLGKTRVAAAGILRDYYFWIVTT